MKKITMMVEIEVPDDTKWIAIDPDGEVQKTPDDEPLYIDKEWSNGWSGGDFDGGEVINWEKTLFKVG